MSDRFPQRPIRLEVVELRRRRAERLRQAYRGGAPPWSAAAGLVALGFAIIGLALAVITGGRP